MDITLERILSLIPRKENGDFVHGARADFARSIGYDSGDIVSMWIKGAKSGKPNRSYLNRLSDISLQYGVSVEWLKGETDDPTPTQSSASVARQMDRIIDGMSREELAALIVRASELLRDK